MDTQELLDKTKIALRSILTSAPRGVPARLILKDYKMMMGKELPFRNLGYGSVEAFIQSVPDTVRLAPGATGELTMFPVANEQTQQISRFVASQKKPKLRKPLRRPSAVARRPSKIVGFSTKSKFGTGRQRTQGGGGSFGGASFVGRSYKPANFIPNAPPRMFAGPWTTQNVPPRVQDRNRPPLLPSHQFFGQSSGTYNTSRQPDVRLTLSSISSSSSPWIPSQRSSMIAQNVRPVRESGGASPRRQRIGSYPTSSNMDSNSTVSRSSSAEPRSQIGPVSSMWKEEYRAARVVAIAELLDCRGAVFNLSAVCVTGYVCTKYREDKMGGAIKYLLYSGISRTYTQNDGCGQFPAVMLYFRSNAWDRNEHLDLLRIGPGTMIKVYGRPFKQITLRKQKEEPAITVYYYEKVPLFRSSTSNEDVSSLRSETPPTTATPPIGLVSGTLRERVHSLLEMYPRGVYVARFANEFEKMFKKEPPSNIVEMARSLPRVICEEEVPGRPILYLKPPSEPPSPRTTTDSGFISKSSSSSSSSRGETPPTASSKDLVSQSLKENIYKLLEAHPKGTFALRLAKMYEKMFDKAPPKEILEIARGLPFVIVEENVPGHPVLHLKTLDQPSEAAPSTRSQSAPTTPLTSPPASQQQLFRTGIQSEKAVQRQTATNVSFSTIKPPLPSTVCFGEDSEMFDVTVTFINSVTSFYVQLIGKEFSQKFQTMVDEMYDYFSKNAFSPVSPVKEDQLYGYLWKEEGDDLWCRALVGGISGSEANVMFPDYGNSDTVEIDNLKELPGTYYEIPFQAIHCCLFGMTEEATDKFTELALENTCIAQVMDSSGSRVAVELMNSDPAIHETINSILLKEAHPISTLKPQLPEPNEPMVPVNLTDIELDGVVILQVQGPGLNQLQQLMTIINDTYMHKASSAADFVSSVTEGSVYCTKYTDKKWYRVIAKKLIPPKKVTVKYVDYGNEQVIEKTKLRKPIANELFSLPFQAVRCSLHGLPPEGGSWTDATVNLLVAYVGSEDLHVTVVEEGTAENIPSVTLFVSQSEGEIVNLNEWLLCQQESFDESFADGEFPEEEEEDIPETFPATAIRTSRPPSAENGLPNQPKKADETNTDEQVKNIEKEDHASPIPSVSKRLGASEQDIIVEAEGGSSLGEVASSSDGLSAFSSPRVSEEGDDAVIKGVVSIRDALAQLSLKDTLEIVDPEVYAEKGNGSAVLGRKENKLNGSSVQHITSSSEIVYNTSLSNVHHSENTSPLLPPSLHVPTLDPSRNASSTPRTPSQGSPVTPYTPSQSSITSHTASQISAHTPSQIASLSPHTPSQSTTFSPHTPSSPASSSQESFLSSGGCTPDESDSRTTADLKFSSLEMNKNIIVMMSSAESPSDFVVQLTSNLSSLNWLMDSLNQTLQESASLPLPASAVRPGLVCCAQSSLDKRWYRCLVVGPEVFEAADNGVKTTEVVVEFLDYGGREGVQSPYLRALPPAYANLPFQGIKCCLYGVLPKGGEGSNWSDEAIDFFDGYVERKLYVYCKSAESGHPCGLVVLDTDSSTDNIVNNEFISKGYADSAL